MKVYTYVMVMVGMMLIFTFMGMGTGFGYILTKIGLISNADGVGINFTGSSFYALLSGIFVIGTGASIAIGYLTKSSTESVQVVAMCLVLASFTADMVSILNYVNAQAGGLGWISMAAACLLVPFIVGFIVALVEWWRGVD